MTCAVRAGIATTEMETGKAIRAAEQGESDSHDFGMSLRYFVRC
jgi:hypothetical protein